MRAWFLLKIVAELSPFELQNSEIFRLMFTLEATIFGRFS